MCDAKYIVFFISLFLLSGCGAIWRFVFPEEAPIMENFIGYDITADPYCNQPKGPIEIPVIAYGDPVPDGPVIIKNTPRNKMPNCGGDACLGYMTGDSKWVAMHEAGHLILKCASDFSPFGAENRQRKIFAHGSVGDVLIIN